MKAAVVFEKGGIPQYADFPDPIVNNENEALIFVKAASIKHLDRARASGKHYSTENKEHQPAIVGSDGVGFLEDGSKVYFFSKKGTVAEKAVDDKKMIVPIPEELDFTIAAALPNAVMGSAMALRFRAKIQTGETVLINGATGFTGKVAVQIAKIYGAKKIIVTGRNEAALKSLSDLGADEYLLMTDENFKEKLKMIHQKTPIDIVIDYLWGKSAENILQAIKGNGSFSPGTRFVSIGAMTGDRIELSSQILRGTDLQISGSGLGSWTQDEVKILLTNIFPEMFELAANKKLKIETEIVDFDNITHIWNQDIDSNKRLVIKI